VMKTLMRNGTAPAVQEESDVLRSVRVQPPAQLCVGHRRPAGPLFWSQSGNEAFDLSGRRRCVYTAETGNLYELDTDKIIGHAAGNFR
jgi:hypothetical protein